MIERLKEANRLHSTILLFLLSIFCISISIFRYQYTDSRAFLFMNWNLFLAFIPYALSSLMVLYKIKNKTTLTITVIIWILFFPNSPYILTDLYHLGDSYSAPEWFDLVLILSYAWAGLLYGFISLFDLETFLSKYISKLKIQILSSLFLFISCFGIYLGRFLRWNSWDIASNPSGLIADISDRLISPFSHSRTWGLTILMGILLNFIYFSIKILRREKQIIS